MINLNAIQTERENPFVGFRPFFIEDALYFFGRDEQTGAMLECLRRHRFVSVVGNSGSGKSSLVMAGVIPTLAGGFLVSDRDVWQFGVMRPGDAPLENLAEALIAALGAEVVGATRDEFAHAMRARGARAVQEALARRAPGTNVLLLADQFEEVFAYMAAAGSDLTDPPGRQVDHLVVEERIRRQSDAHTFVSVLMAMAGPPNEHVYVITTMRTDFLGDCDRFTGLPELINSAGYLVPRLSRQDLRDAVEGPARLKRVRVTPRLSDFVLNEIGDKPDLLPILQHALHRTWEARAEAGDSGPLDLKHLEAVGGLRQALSNEADALVAGVDERTLAAVFRRLTRVDAGRRRVRRPSTLSELLAVSGASKEMLAPFLDKLSKEGTNLLYRSESAMAGDPRYDISHESLIRQWSRLQHWIDEERELAKFYAELCENAARLRDTGELSESSIMARRALRRGVGSRQMNEVWASRYANEVPASWREVQWYLLMTKKRQRRVVLQFGVGFAAIAMGVFAVLLFSGAQARNNARLEKLRIARSLVQNDPTIAAVYLANGPMNELRDEEFMSVMDEMDNRILAEAQFTGVRTFDVIGDGSKLLIAKEGGRIHIVNSNGTGRPLASLDVPGDSVRSFSALGDKNVFVALYDGSLIHWHLNEPRVAHKVAVVPEIEWMYALKNSSRVLIYADQKLTVFDGGNVDSVWTSPIREGVVLRHPTDDDRILVERVTQDGRYTGVLEERLLRSGTVVSEALTVQPIRPSNPEYSADGDTLFIAPDSNHVAAYVFTPAANGRRRAVLLWRSLVKSPVTDLSAGGTTKEILVAFADGSVDRVNRTDGRSTKVLQYQEASTGVEAIPGTSWMVSSDMYGDIRVTWLGRESPSLPLKGHSPGVNLLWMEAREKTLVTHDASGKLRVWSVAKLSKEFGPLDSDSGIASLMVAEKTGDRFFADYAGNFFRRSNSEAGERRTEQLGSVNGDWRVSVDATQVVDCNRIEGCTLKNLREGHPLTLDGIGTGESLHDFSPSGAHLLFVRDSTVVDSTVEYSKVVHSTLLEYSVANRRVMSTVRVDSDWNWYPSPNGDAIGLYRAPSDPGTAGDVQLWLRRAGVLEKRIQLKPKTPIWNFNSGGDKLVVLMDTTDVRVVQWDSTGALIEHRYLLPRTDLPSDITLDATGTWLALLVANSRVELFRLSPETSSIVRLRVPSTWVGLQRLTFVPWDSSLVATTRNGNGYVWSVQTRRFEEDSTGLPSWSAMRARVFDRLMLRKRTAKPGDYLVSQRTLTMQPLIPFSNDTTQTLWGFNPAIRSVSIASWMGKGRVRDATWILDPARRRNILRPAAGLCIEPEATVSEFGGGRTLAENCAARSFASASFDRIEANRPSRRKERTKQ